MTTTPEHDARIAQMTLASVYPHYIRKIESKGRHLHELEAVFNWLIGMDPQQIAQAIADKWTFAELFSRTQYNPVADTVKGTICGYRIQDIQTPLTRQVRVLDKLVDELAKGKALEKVLRDA